MDDITREVLHAYLDDALGEAETARVEQGLRADEELRRRLRQVMDERDRGEHSLGAIWRRERLTCPTRESLSSWLLEVLDDGEQEYVKFHLEVVGCAWCQANLADLHESRKGSAPVADERRKRIFTSSAGLLQSGGPPP